MNRRKFVLLAVSCCFVAAFSTATTESYYVEWESGSLKSEKVVALILEYFIGKGLRNVTLNEEEAKKYLESREFDRPLPELELQAGPRIWVTVFKEAENKISIHWIWAQAGCNAAKNITGVNERMAELPSFLESGLDANIIISTSE